MAPWDKPTFLNAFPEKLYDPKSANRLRRFFSLFVLVPALGGYLWWLLKTESGESATFAFAPANVYAKHQNSILQGTAGDVVDKLWATKLNTAHESWPGFATSQGLPEIPLLIKVYGSVAKFATVHQRFNYYSRCEKPIIEAFPDLDLPNLPLGRGTSSGLKGEVVSVLATGETTVNLDVNRNSGSSETFESLAWPGDSLVTQNTNLYGGETWEARCDACDNQLFSDQCDCYFEVRTKLCGVSMPEHLTSRNIEDFVSVRLPLENSTSSLRVSVEMLTPQRFMSNGEECSDGCQETYSAMFFDVAPYERRAVTTSLKVSYAASGEIPYGGYVLDALGEVTLARVNHDEMLANLENTTPEERANQQHIFGPELRLVLANILVTQTKPPSFVALIGVVGGTAGILVAALGVVIGLLEMTAFKKAGAPSAAKEKEAPDSSASKV